MGKAQQEWLAAALLARCEYLNLEVGELSAVYTTGSSDSLNIVSENTSLDVCVKVRHLCAVPMEDGRECGFPWTWN